MAVRQLPGSKSVSKAGEVPASPLPMPGRIVLIKLIDGTFRPAIVVTAFGANVNVQMFTNHNEDKEILEQMGWVSVGFRDAVPPLVHLRSRRQGDEPGDWSWPPRA